MSSKCVNVRRLPLPQDYGKAEWVRACMSPKQRTQGLTRYSKGSVISKKPRIAACKLVINNIEQEACQNTHVFILKRKGRGHVCNARIL